MSLGESKKLIPKQVRAPVKGRAAWLNSSTLGIGLASLFSDVGHEMATTAMPIVATKNAI